MAAVIEPRYRLRDMVRGDLEAIVDIESSAYPFPWTHGIFTDCLRVGYRCRVAERDGLLVAYSIVSLSVGEAHVLNLCVAAAERRHGLARLLLEQALAEARMLGAARMFLEVRPSNRAAIRLYQSSGFRAIGRRPGYYPAAGGREDAMVMVRHLVD